MNYLSDKDFITNVLDKYLDFKNGASASVVWNFEENPYFHATARVLTRENDQSTSERVGSLTTVYRYFVFNKKILKAGLFGDFVVMPEHRTLSPALKLAKDTVNDILRDTAFVYGFPNDKALPVLKMSGFKVVGHLARYASIVQYRLYLSRVIRVPYIPYMIGMTIDAIKNTFYWVVNKIYCRNLYFKEINKFDNSIDMLSKFSVLGSFISNSRRADYLNWRYLNNPQHEYICFTSHNNKNDCTNGYLVLEKVDDSLHIVDVYADDEQVLSCLFKLAKNKAVSFKCTTASFGFMGSERIISILKNNGFYLREKNRSVIVKCNNNFTLSKIIDKNNWYIVDGDEDQ